MCIWPEIYYLTISFSGLPLLVPSFNQFNFSPKLLTDLRLRYLTNNAYYNYYCIRYVLTPGDTIVVSYVHLCVVNRF